MKKRVLAGAMTAAMMVSMVPGAAFATEDGYSMNLADYAGKWTHENGYYALKNVVYCTNPTNPSLQAMNIYVPEAYMNADGTVNAQGAVGEYTAETAPIIYANGVAGYMEAAPGSVTSEYIENGYICVSVGSRGRSTQGEDGTYTGKSPWGLVDLKAGVRFLKANDQLMAGDANKIISVGTSAGGAMSALLGSTGNSANYDSYLEEMGAVMDATDDVFAAQCYCPITDLEHADMAYEWQYVSDSHYTGFLIPAGDLNDFQQAISKKLAEDYVAYYNSLELVDAEGNPLVMGEDGRSGSAYDYIMNVISEAATTYLTKLQNGELDVDYTLEEYLKGEYTKAPEMIPGMPGGPGGPGGPGAAPMETNGTDLTGIVEWDGTTATVTDLEAFVAGYLGRMKACLAFDDLDFAQGENEELADSSTAAAHFNGAIAGIMDELKDEYPEEYAQYHDVYAAAIGDEELADRIYLINPMNYIGTEEDCDTAPYFRIRVGTADAHTSFTVAMNLALKLQETEDTQVDYAMVWDEPHGAADYAGEFCAWVDSIAAPQAAQGTFELLENIAVTDSQYTPEGDYSFYLYSPSNPHNFDLMSGQLNGVIYLYPDEPYASQEEAYAALEELGLIDIAEKSPAYIVIPNPLNGESYTQADLDVYYESNFYLAGGKIISFTPPTGEFERRTYHNLQYIMAEGDGATFVNDVLSQNANRIAGILTFGGESTVQNVGVAVPAYLVNPSDAAVTYWKAANEVDTQNGNTFINSSYEQKKVILAEGGDSFDAATIATAWADLLSRSTRAPMANDVVANTMDMSEWVLMTWPNYSELGLTLKETSYNWGNDENPARDYIEYDYIPDSYTGEEAVPLVVLLHGFSEDPLCPAATCGWADKCSEEGFILIAPDYINDLTASGVVIGCIMTAVNQAIETYNIDTSRVYVTGFSMGGMSTMMTSFANADVFAAAAPMAGSANITSVQSDAEKYDLPVFFLAGNIDDKNVFTDEDGNIAFIAMGDKVWPALAAFNGIEAGEPDYSFNPFGMKADQESTVTRQGIQYYINDYYSDQYTNPIMELVEVNGVAHACSDVYADLAWNFMSKFSRAADGTLVELTDEVTFSDVSADAWYAQSVNDCAAAGIINGYEDGTFKPEQTLTRAEAVTMIARAAGLTVDSAAKADFTDCADHWASATIAAAVKAGIVNGYGDGTFAPDKTVTRAELVKMIVSAKNMDVTKDMTSTFTDCTGHWADAVLAAAQQAGIANGYEDGTFKPDQSIKRAEAAKLVAGAYLK